jgi:hypothetical protein
MIIFAVVGLLAAAFCICRSIADFRAKRYVWAATGMLSGAALLVTPMQTHAVKFEKPLLTQPK